MNYFHTHLSHLISKDLRSGAAIAREAGVSQGTISNITSGIDCSAAILGKICQAFPAEQDRLGLLGSWLKDKAEEAGFTSEDMLASLGASKGLRIPASIRPAIVHFCEMAPNTPSLVNMFNDLAIVTGMGQPKPKQVSGLAAEIATNKDEMPPVQPPKSARKGS